MGVSTTFPHDDLDEEIYMKQPDEYSNPEKSNHVCKLKKNIYALKEAACCWNLAINSNLTENGYKNYDADSCMHIKSMEENGKSNFIIIASYVDDKLLFCNNVDLLDGEKISLKWTLKLKIKVKFILLEFL